MPYTHKKVGDKYVVYKHGKKVGSTAGTKAALDKYLAALHINADKKQSVKESIEEPGMDLGAGHPGCEDTVGRICVVLRPRPEDSPEDIVHQTHAFGMHQFDPSTVHGIYQDEKQAQQVAEAMCNELYENLKAIEEKKNLVTTKIEETIKELQKQVNKHLEEASANPEGADQHHMQAEAKMAKIKELRDKSRMVEASKKPMDQEKDPKKKIEEGWLDRTTAKLKGTGAQIGTGLGNLKAYFKGDKEAIKDPVLAKNMAMLQQKARTLDKELTAVYTDVVKLFPQENLAKNPAFQPVYKKYMDLIKATRQMSNMIASGNIDSTTQTPTTSSPQQTQQSAQPQQKPQGGETQQAQAGADQKPENRRVMALKIF